MVSARITTSPLRSGLMGASAVLFSLGALELPTTIGLSSSYANEGIKASGAENHERLSALRDFVHGVYQAQSEGGSREQGLAYADLSSIATQVASIVLGRDESFSDYSEEDLGYALERLTLDCLRAGFFFRGCLIGTSDSGYFVSVSLYEVGDSVSSGELPLINLPYIQSRSATGSAYIYESRRVILDRYDSFAGNRIQEGGRIAQIGGVPVATSEGFFLVLRPDVFSAVAREHGIAADQLRQETIDNELAHLAMAPVMQLLGPGPIVTIGDPQDGGLLVYPFHLEEAVSDYWSLRTTRNLQGLIRSRVISCPSGYELSCGILTDTVNSMQSQGIIPTSTSSLAEVLKTLDSSEEVSNNATELALQMYEMVLSHILTHLEATRP